MTITISLIRFILLLSTVFLLPLIGVYKNFGYEHTKVLFFIVFISLIGLFLVRGKFKWSLIVKTAGIFIIISRTAQFLLAGLVMIWLIKEIVAKRLLIRGAVLAILVLTIFSSMVFVTGLFLVNSRTG